MIWRLGAEHRSRTISAAQIEHVERRAQKLVAASLLPAAYVCFDATATLWRHERPEFSTVGVVLTTVSMAVMLVLARAKRRAAVALESRALEADAFQTTACWWLSVAALAGLALNGVWVVVGRSGCGIRDRGPGSQGGHRSLAGRGRLLLSFAQV